MGTTIFVEQFVAQPFIEGLPQPNNTIFLNIFVPSARQTLIFPERQGLTEPKTLELSRKKSADPSTNLLRPKGLKARQLKENPGPKPILGKKQLKAARISQQQPATAKFDKLPGSHYPGGSAGIAKRKQFVVMF